MAAQYSFSDVAKHTDPNNLWIVIRNNVYDVTKFLTEHPGGEEALLEVAGKDGTDGFEEAGHSIDARAMLDDYFIGQICESERKPERKKEAAGTDAKKWACCICLPFVFGVIATVIYRVYFRLNTN